MRRAGATEVQLTSGLPAASLLYYELEPLRIGSARGAQFRAKKRRREPNGSRLPSFNYPAYFSQPEQEAQHSVEAQHDALAAFAAPAKPSATTASNRIALMFFMDFSPLKNHFGFCRPMAMPPA